MSYDAWKCCPPEGDDRIPDDVGEDEPEWTCDCGEPIDPSLGGVSMCRACYETCDTEPPWARTPEDSDASVQDKTQPFSKGPSST